MTILRSLLFNTAFYVLTTVMLIFGAPFFLFCGQRVAVETARLWGRLSRFLLALLVGTRIEFRGLENIPDGGAIIAAKHQSALETFALLLPLSFPTYVVKRELTWIPLFGLYMIRAGMISVNRGGGSAALRSLLKRAETEATKGRQIIIFPEGTRRPPGAEPSYHYGVTRMYAGLKMPVVPVALNSGLFWPRRRFLRYPGTVAIEFLPPIAPGLPPKEFARALPEIVDEATDRLMAEAANAEKPPPIPDAAQTRIDNIQPA